MKTLILAFSGHASLVFDQWVKDSQITVIQSQWDNGGHTGLLIEFYNYLKSNYPEGPLADGEIQVPPPMGDLKTQIARFLHDNNPLLAYLMSCKVPRKELAKYFKLLLQQFNQEFPNFFSAQDYSLLLFLYREYRKFIFLSLEKGLEGMHSLGNLFLGFLYIYSQINFHNYVELFKKPRDHNDVFFQLLKRLEFIPDNVRQEFLCNGSMTLLAYDVNGVAIVGESRFDLDKIINPEVVFGPSNRVQLGSYIFQTGEEEQSVERFAELVEQNDIIIIPPGSISNWMPIVNKFKDFLIQSGKPIIWIPNSFCHISEADIEAQYEYLYKLFGTALHILCPVGNAFDQIEDLELRKKFIAAYEGQHKREANITFFDSLNNPNINIGIQYEVLQPSDGGIKYNQDSVKAGLQHLSGKLSGEENREFNLEMK